MHEVEATFNYLQAKYFARSNGMTFMYMQDKTVTSFLCSQTLTILRFPLAIGLDMMI